MGLDGVKGKIALVTGASRGIGQAIALGLGAAGATVIGTATTLQGAKGITEQFAQRNLIGKGWVLDVTQHDSIVKLFEEIGNDPGYPAILVNNAGKTQDNLMLMMADEQWHNIIDTNLTSAYRLTKACLKRMFRNRWGRIINISSVVGLTGNPGQANYAAAKAGLIGFSKSLAQEMASRGITVNVVAPGFIETDMTGTLSELQRKELFKRIPMKRLGKPNDIANIVVFLASDAASYITGETFHINGGMYMP